MKALEPRRIKYIVLHTAAASRGPDFDSSWEAIDRWHKERGFDGIGYHWVIRLSGDWEGGRAMESQGAHCLGINDQSIGICFSGHGDLEPPTPAQWARGAELVASLMRAHGVEISNVIGHREVNQLVDQGVLPRIYRTDKTCPGILFDLDAFRRTVVQWRFPPPPDLEIPLPNFRA